MKTIYRQLFFAAILVAAVASGSLVANAQGADPCENATAVYGEWTKLFELKDLASRKATIEKGKDFVSKYSNCEATKDGAKFISDSLPGLEENYRKLVARAEENALLKKFDEGMKAKNWDEVYSSGKEILAKYPEKYRAALLVLGSIGLDETDKTPSITKYNDDTIKYAKQAIAEIEAGKTFSAWGVAPFVYKGKDDALGWMNFTVGYILFKDKKNKKDAAAYMYKASQIAFDKKSDPVLFSTIGSFYVDDLNKNILELKSLPAPVETDTPEVKQQKVDAIKDMTGMVNGAAERVMDARARAYKAAPMTPTAKVFRDSLKASFKEIYDIRFQKPDTTTPTVDAWIDMAAAKPLVNPSTPITPVQDAEKAPATTATPGPGTPVTVKPSTPAGVKPTSPAMTTPVKPAAPGAKPVPASAKPAVAVVRKKKSR